MCFSASYSPSWSTEQKRDSSEERGTLRSVNSISALSRPLIVVLSVMDVVLIPFRRAGYPLLLPVSLPDGPISTQKR